MTPEQEKKLEKDATDMAIEAVTGWYGDTASLASAIEHLVWSYLEDHKLRWLPIHTAPQDEKTGLIKPAFFGFWVEPSEEAARNGQKRYWSQGFGREVYTSHFSGLIRGSPTHYLEIPQPPEEK